MPPLPFTLLMVWFAAGVLLTGTVVEIEYEGDERVPWWGTVLAVAIAITISPGLFIASVVQGDRGGL